MYLISESQHKYIRYQLDLEKERVSGLTADATLISGTTPVTPSAPESTTFSLPPLVHEKMVEIVKLCTQRLEDNLAVVTARRDRAFQDLADEREWIKILENQLSIHGIPLPKYPF